MAQEIREVMSQNPVMMNASSTVSQAAKRMRDEDIGDVIVMDGDNHMCGILTDRDIVVRAIATGKDPNSAKLDEICSRSVTTVSAADSVDKAVQIMRDKAVRRIPVMDKGKPIGIVSIGDLALERDRRSVLGEISGKPPNK